MKITADTITDEQIRELRITITREAVHGLEPERFQDWLVYDLALQMRNQRDRRAPSNRQIEDARARCAEILNARLEVTQ